MEDVVDLLVLSVSCETSKPALPHVVNEQFTPLVWRQICHVNMFGY